MSSPRLRALGALSVALASSALSARDAAAQAEPAPVVVAATPGGPLPTQAPAPSMAEDDPAALLAQLDAELEHSNPAEVGTMPNLSLYGFADVGFCKYFLPAGNVLSSILYTKSAFAVGNLNLYLSSELGSNWRSLVEVRFSYLPNGARRVVGSQVERTDTTATDYTSFSRQLQTGSILLQRAWIEYAHDPALLRRNPKLKSLGVVLVTGAPLSELAFIAKEVNAAAVVSKSELHEQLLPAVHRAFKRD